MQGVAGVWVGTRFLTSTESGASKMHKEAVLAADYPEIQRSLVLSGRPLRIRMNDYVRKWEEQPEKMQNLLNKGIIPFDHDLDNGVDVEFPCMMGQVAGLIKEIKPAESIIKEMVQQAIEQIKAGQKYIVGSSKL
jgi:NAD(P)H-dependent flavin oxidoreductase YrpB (nitropropane dioxygenase family)